MNIAFYPFWAARTLFSLIQVISITTLTCLIYRQTEWIGYALLFLCVYLLGHVSARFTFHMLIQRYTFSRLLIGIPVTKTLLLIGIASSLPHLKLHMAITLIGAALLSVINGWEVWVLNKLQSQLTGGEDIAKASSLLSFSNYTVAGIGLVMTIIAILYLGRAQVLWAAVALSLVALALIVTVHHLTQNFPVLRQVWIPDDLCINKRRA